MAAFDDGWPVHPLDDDDWTTPKPRTLYLGTALSVSDCIDGAGTLPLP